VNTLHVIERTLIEEQRAGLRGGCNVHASNC
jgi:hypothetical protein